MWCRTEGFLRFPSKNWAAAAVWNQICINRNIFAETLDLFDFSLLKILFNEEVF
jgi:hypothetical protein